jgi:hypothetical protein
MVTTRNGPASEVSLTINPMDPLNLVGGSKDFTLGETVGCAQYNVWSGVYWTKDGGQHWENALMPGYPGDANTTLLSHYPCNSDPVLAAGSDGAIYYSGLAYGGAPASASSTGACPGDQAAPLCGGSIWVAKSTDGGDTWGGYVNVAVSDDGQVGLDKQWFAVDPSNPQNLVLTWIQFTGLAAYFLIAASFDGAATWTPPATLAEVGSPLHQFAMPAIGPDGTVYVVWNNFGAAGLVPLPGGLPVGNPTDSQVMFTKNVPGTPGFLPATPIAPIHNIASPVKDTEVRAESMPILAVAPDGPNAGHLYIVWADENEGQDDILFITSSDGGSTWSAPTKVNQDATQADQFMAWVTTDEEGGVDVLFMDRAYDANGELDATIARSTDEGQTWKQVRVTPRSWAIPEGCYHQNGFPFIGDYVAIVAGNGTLHPFFPVGYNGRCDVVSAAIPYGAVSGAGGNATRPANVSIAALPRAAWG